jgi:fructose-specific phosphotransferase system IIC component
MFSNPFTTRAAGGSTGGLLAKFGFGQQRKAPDAASDMERLLQSAGQIEQIGNVALSFLGVVRAVIARSIFQQSTFCSRGASPGAEGTA